MQRRWIEFDDGPESIEKDEIYATINRKGELIINRIGFEALGRPAYIKMAFDKFDRVIGLRQVPRHTPGAFPVKPKGRCGHQVIRAKPFCNRWEIDIAHTVRFRGPVVEEGVLELDLKQLRNARRKKAH